MKPESKTSYSIQVLQRTLKILDGFLEFQKPLSLEEISQFAGLPKSTAFRIIANLVKANYLTEQDNGYWLGLKMLRFGAAVEGSLDLKQRALPYLLELRDLYNETVHFAVLENNSRVVYLDKLSSQQAVAVMASRIGNSAPVYCTGVGKALAAFLPEAQRSYVVESQQFQQFTANTITTKAAFVEELKITRLRGYAIDDEEHEKGVRCIAAPIFNHLKEVTAAISISVPAERMPTPIVDSAMSKKVMLIAAQISTELGYLP